MASPESSESEASRYSLEQFAPEVQAEFRILTEKCINVIRVMLTKERVALFFQAPNESIEDRHMTSVMQFAEAVMPQLVLGAYCGPNYDIRTDSKGKKQTPASQIDALRKTGSTLLNIHNPPELWHEMTHAITAIGRSSDARQPHSAIPVYMRLRNREAQYSDHTEWKNTSSLLDSEEVLSELWDYRLPLRDTYLSLIRESRAAYPRNDETAYGVFVTKLVERSTRPDARVDAFAHKVLRRVFNEYENNPMLMFDIYSGMVEPYMEEHRRREAKQGNPKR